MFYKFAPRRRTLLREVWTAALFVTLCFEILQRIFLLYTQNVGNFNKLYGTFGTVVALLLWIYLSGSIIILGGCLCAAKYEIEMSLTDQAESNRAARLTRGHRNSPPAESRRRPELRRTRHPARLPAAVARTFRAGHHGADRLDELRIALSAARRAHDRTPRCPHPGRAECQPLAAQRQWRGRAPSRARWPFNRCSRFSIPTLSTVVGENAVVRLRQRLYGTLLSLPMKFLRRASRRRADQPPLQRSHSAHGYPGRHRAADPSPDHDAVRRGDRDRGHFAAAVVGHGLDLSRAHVGRGVPRAESAGVCRARPRTASPRARPLWRRPCKASPM